MDGFEEDEPAQEKPKAAAVVVADEPKQACADLDAEEALLGGLLLEPSRILAIAQLLGSGARGVFSEKRNDELFAVLVKMASEGEAIDLVTVGHRMYADGVFETIGMRSRLVQLISAVPSGAHARYHAGIVRNWAVIRRLSSTGVDMARRAPTIAPREEEITEFTDQVEEAIRSDFGRVSMSEGPQETVSTFRGIQSRNFPTIIESRDGIATGLTALDAHWGSFRPGQLITIGARTGGGKTSLALKIVSNAFRDLDRVVLYFSMEMSREELCQRMVAQETGLSMVAMREKKLEEGEWATLDDSVSRRERENFIVDETGRPSVGQVAQSAERIRARFGRIDLVVCDGVQLMQAKAENRSVEIGKITRGLKGLAKELGCPLIGTTQLNRGDTNKGNRVPQNHDLKESSSIEQDSDIVILLWRPDGSNPQESATSAKAHISKHRNGPTGIELLKWSGSNITFLDAERPLFAVEGFPPQ